LSLIVGPFHDENRTDDLVLLLGKPSSRTPLSPIKNEFNCDLRTVRFVYVIEAVIQRVLHTVDINQLSEISWAEFSVNRDAGAFNFAG
jgi:hypothetical protein